ncbi:helix-turn-helix transcriptional regulator [Ruegeria sp. MALMAid1280]|uniref:helix-turn-helix transcriptional regulator n=1 Tax=Ruegeria sp. MALMAid1280 TaxID=3411634 RepID=UPI003BA3CDF3
MTETKKTAGIATGNLATVEDLVKFLRTSRADIPGIMARMGVPKRGIGFPWQRIWLALGVDMTSVVDTTDLYKPMLKLDEVAALLGESSKTTRRRADGMHRDQSIPKHIDLGPRKRIYFAAEIQSWLYGDPIEFERCGKNLSFIEQKPKGRAPKHCRKSDADTNPLSAPQTAAALFMGPPPKL